MKKKILAMCLVIALATTAIAGATLAYFTDTDAADNTFAVGGVEIKLIEQQRNKDKTDLEKFENNKVLMPIVGSAQGEKDKFGQPVAANYCDKMITVKNTGKSDAYVRLFVGIPAVLDDGVPSFNASKNALHFNFGNFKGTDGKWHTTYKNQWSWNAPDGSWYYFDTTIGEDGVKYNIYYAYYQKVLAPNDVTEQAVSGLYLDKGIDTNAEGNLTMGGEDLGWKANATIKMPVFAQAVQAAGFASAEAAFAESGLPENPWIA